MPTSGEVSNASFTVKPEPEGDSGIFNQTDDMDQSCTSAKVVEIEQLPDFCIYLYILFLYVLPISPGCVRLHLSFNFFDYMTIDYTLVLIFFTDDTFADAKLQKYKSKCKKTTTTSASIPTVHI